MKDTQLIALIRGIIAKFRADQLDSVSLVSLERLLDDIENHIRQHPEQPMPTPEHAAMFAIEHAKLQHASNLAQYEARNRSWSAMLKAVIATAKVAMQSLILVNGGAAVALLAFIGQLAINQTHLAPNQTHGPAIHAFALPLACFVFGVWASGVRPIRCGRSKTVCRS